MTLILALLAAAAGMLAALGVHLTSEQELALGNLAQAAVALGIYARSKVTPAS